MFLVLSHSLPLKTDLSKRVALSWHESDDEVKLFCAEVSDILMHEYKKALYRQRKDSINSSENEDSSTQSQVAKSKTRNPFTKKSSQPTSTSTTMVPRQVHSTRTISTRTTEGIVTDQITSSSATTAAPSTIDAALYAEPVMRQMSNGPSVGHLSLPPSSYHQNYYDYASNQVDINDKAIWDMWNASDF